MTDADGNLVPPVPTPPLAWHESLRYFRLSQTTDDLFDAYRNAYLALESILSSIAPQRTDAAGKVNEGESGYLKLAESHLGVRRSGGGMFAVAFRMMMAPTLERMTAHVSDDESPPDKSDLSPNPAGRMLKELLPTGPVDASGSFVVSRVWSALAADLAGLPFVRRAVGMVDGHPGMVAVLEARLTLGSSAYRLEVMLGARGSNTRQPRERYSL